jgi:signal transduction histidine kinase
LSAGFVGNTYVTLPKLSKPLAMVVCVAFVLAIARVEWWGPGVAYSVVYLLPIAVGTWYAGLTFGLVLTAGCFALRFAIHMSSPAWTNLPGIGGLAEVFGFLATSIVVILLSKVKTMSMVLDRKVEERTSALVEEVAERKRAEEALRTLSAQLSDAEEAERARMAADIHDSIGQSLSALKINLGVLADRMGASGPPPPDLVESLNLIDDIVKQVRTFTFRIHPAMLEDLGLMPTFRPRIWSSRSI